jgi:hypothetical protein
LQYYWLNKDLKKATSLFSKTTFYQETPYMKPYTTFEEIVDEWQHVKNEDIHKVELHTLAIDGHKLIVEWFLRQNHDELTGIYEIIFNNNLGCISFRS